MYDYMKEFDLELYTMMVISWVHFQIVSTPDTVQLCQDHGSTVSLLSTFRERFIM
jgi:hypothetical protein